MDLLKSSSFFTAVDLQRSHFTDGGATQRDADRLNEGEQHAGGRDTLQAFAALSLDSIDETGKAGALADQGEVLIMLQVWQGEAAGDRHLIPSVPAPTVDSRLPLVEARDCWSNYVLSAF